ncbi:MAG: hypothetical protein ABSH22_20740, partial [Tepidisphaeraceae bacterium]
MRRKGLFALSAAASAVGFIGLMPHMAKADVLSNAFNFDGQDTTIDDGDTFEWMDLGPTVDSPPAGVYPGSQDIAQFDSVNTNEDNAGGSFTAITG